MVELGVLLRDREVASLLCCSKATVWRRVADGTLPAPIKLGGTTRWVKSEVLAVIDVAKTERFSN